MTSNDIGVIKPDNGLNSRMDRIEMRLDNIERRLDNIDKALTTIGYELKYNANDTAHLQTSVYWGFVVIAVVVALVGFVIALMIDIAVSKALSVKQ